MCPPIDPTPYLRFGGALAEMEAQRKLIEARELLKPPEQFEWRAGISMLNNRSVVRASFAPPSRWAILRAQLIVLVAEQLPDPIALWLIERQIRRLDTSRGAAP